MSAEFRYFKVLGGKVSAAWERFYAHRKTQIEARGAVAREFGASGTYANPTEIVGLVFKDGGVPPAGWKAVAGEPTVFKPHGGGKENKAIRAKFRASKLDNAEGFQTEVLGVFDPFFFMDGMRIRFMYPENIAGVRILCVPKIANNESHEISKNKAWTPPDEFTVEIKTSEYFQIKEAAETRTDAQAVDAKGVEA